MCDACGYPDHFNEKRVHPMLNSPTLGPWQIRDLALGEVCDERGELLAVTFEMTNAPGSRQANALLITKTPDLYKALVRLMGLISDGILVRNTASDGDPGFAMRQLPLVTALSEAVQVIAEAQGSLHAR